MGVLFYFYTFLSNLISHLAKNVTTGTKLDVKYWSDRAANIVATQLPFVIGLTMKNNIISCKICHLTHI